MPHLIFRWLTLTAAILVSAYVIEGIRVAGFFSALCAAALLGIFNAILRPIFILMTLPINILSFGLFTFIINAALLKLVSGLIRGFDVYGFWPAVIGSLVISLVNGILTMTMRERRPPAPTANNRTGKSDVIDLKDKGNNHWE
jgi:putative membrane protein